MRILGAAIAVLAILAGCSSSKSSSAGSCPSEAACLSKAATWAHTQLLKPSSSTATYESGDYSSPNNLGWALVLQYNDNEHQPFEMKVVPNGSGLCGTASSNYAKSASNRTICFAARDDSPYYVYSAGTVAYLVYADGRLNTSASGSPQWALKIVDGLE